MSEPTHSNDRKHPTGFESAQWPTLSLSTQHKVWGDTSKHREPTSRQFTNALRREVLGKDGHQCMFCGFTSKNNEVHNITDNHEDVRPDNLRAIDPLCHGWNHLGELSDEEAVLAYLPRVSAQDVNHLQRTIMVALASGDASLKDEARQLLNWMASHRDYVQDAWGSYSPATFGEALRKHEDRNKREWVLEGLALVFNPQVFVKEVKGWVSEVYQKFHCSSWKKVAHNILNSPH